MLSTPRSNIFELFPDLAPELRAIILEMALPHGQLVCIDQTEPHSRKLKANYKLPALLHCSRETRDLTRRFHKPMFADRMGGVPIYFDQAQDILTFKQYEAAIYFYMFGHRPVQEKISKLAINCTMGTFIAAPKPFVHAGRPDKIWLLDSGLYANQHHYLLDRVENSWRNDSSSISGISKPTIEILSFSLLEEKVKELSHSKPKPVGGRIEIKDQGAEIEGDKGEEAEVEGVQMEDTAEEQWLSQ